MTKFYKNCRYFVEPELFHLASAPAPAIKSGSSRLRLHNTVYMRIIDHNHIFRPKNKQLNSTVPTSVMCNKQIFKNCFWVPRDSGDLQNFFKSLKCPILPQEGQTSIFIQKLVWCPKLAGTRVRSDSDQLQKKMVLMVAIPNFLVLQPLVPFMRHHSEKKNC